LKPLTHAEHSVRRYGGAIEQYLPIHDFLDMSKAVHADMRHRALLHNSLGPFIAESIFGSWIDVDKDKRISVRQIAEDHILEDLGRIPNASEFLSLIPETEMWRFGIQPTTTRKRLHLVD
jgi:hypothetical protein